MRKTLLVGLALGLGLLGIAGCGSKSGLKQDEKIILLGQKDVASMTTISADDLNTKITNDESFVLMIGSKSCTSCIAFKPIINEYIAETGSIIYLVETNVSSIIDYQYTPTLAIFKDGEVVSKIDPSTKGYDKVFTNLDSLSDYIASYCVVAPQVLVSIDQLREMIANDESFTIYYSWNACGDCTYLYTHFLEDYYRDNASKQQPLYMIETAEWRTGKPSTEPKVGDADYDTAILAWNKWKNFATEFQFVSYYGGKVPTLQYYSKGEMSEMFVYLNDIAKYYKDSSGNTAMDISDSYFADSPYIGKTMLYADYKDTVSKGFYDAKLKTFLDKYLAK